MWSTRSCYILNIKALDLVVLDKKILLRFHYASQCKKVSEFDLEMPQSHTAGQPTAP